jgi:hypothetical protein
MSAYLIVIIALLPVSPIIKVAMTKVGVGTKRGDDRGVGRDNDYLSRFLCHDRSRHF